ncbi:HAD-IA family hydrolase [Congregibacter variabilis]|uniref:HAD-IA family hydrolase n=1 Tax=Congregibacter variabilis TaxID=3081200 RepID=A0ABZ0IA08_9GAMM|nr:HAD-IA family hydrolase [Congregibacter sp. IMCC43200]
MHPGARLRGVIFDLDGTLIDTADDFIPVVQQLRAECGHPPMAAPRIRASVSNGSRALVALALDLSDKDPDFEVYRQRLLTLYSEVLGCHSALYPGVSALLKQLEDKGIAWGIATNKPREYTLPLLAKLGLTPASVVCPDDVTHAKPHPESLEKGCRELRCEISEAVYLGDHLRDIQAGQRAGMFTIAAAYGYIETGDSAHNWGADLVAQRSEDLCGLLFPLKERAYA